jgi:hypothetical protein
MTWVEVTLLLFGAAALGGLATRRTRAGRVLAWTSLLAIGVLLATVGRELITDLL